MSGLLTLGVLSFVMAGRASAEVGVVTIDGDVVPAMLFAGYEEPGRHEDCGPIADSRRRDAVVENRLYVREGERMGITLRTRFGSDREKAAEELERLADDAPDARRSSLAWNLADLRAEGYRLALIGDVEPAAFEKRYRQAIEERHPKLVDVPLFRRTHYTFADRAARDRARVLIAAGRPLAELRRLGEMGVFDPYQHEEWRVFGASDHIALEDVDALDTGDIVYPDRHRGRSIVHIVERKRLSRIRPYQPINGDDYHARRIVHALVREQRLQQLEKTLWAAATVEEDGVPIGPPGPLADCEPP